MQDRPNATPLATAHEAVQTGESEARQRAHELTWEAQRVASRAATLARERSEQVAELVRSGQASEVAQALSGKGRYAHCHPSQWPPGGGLATCGGSGGTHLRPGADRGGCPGHPLHRLRHPGRAGREQADGRRRTKPLGSAGNPPRQEQPLGCLCLRVR